MDKNLEGYDYESEDCPYQEGVKCDCNLGCTNCTIFQDVNSGYLGHFEE